MVYILFAITVQLPPKNGCGGGILTQDPDHKSRYQNDALDRSAMIPLIIRVILVLNLIRENDRGVK